MRDEEIEEGNAAVGADHGWCGNCREYVSPEQAEAHERYHEEGQP